MGPLTLRGLLLHTTLILDRILVSIYEQMIVLGLVESLRFDFFLLRCVFICIDERTFGLVESLWNLLLLLLSLFVILGRVEQQILAFMDFVVLCEALQPVNVDDAFIQWLIAPKHTCASRIAVDQVFLLELAVVARVIGQVRRLTDQE